MVALKVIIETIVGWITKKPSHSQQQSGAVGSQNIQAQAGRDINITLERQQEARREATNRADNVLASMPQLVSEMRADLLAPDAIFIREFYVLPNRNCCIGFSPKRRFTYYENEHQNLRGQLDVLQAHGFLKDVTPFGNNAPIYRMTENLVRLLSNATLDK